MMELLSSERIPGAALAIVAFIPDTRNEHGGWGRRKETRNSQGPRGIQTTLRLVGVSKELLKLPDKERARPRHTKKGTWAAERGGREYKVCRGGVAGSLSR